MVSDKRGGRPVEPGAARGPRAAVNRPGSVNRGFASLDPERQCEADAEGGKAGDAAGKPAQPGARRAATSGPAQPPKAGRRGRGEPTSGEEGGSA